jgi:ABC-2 type transport system ATP-binding protein
MSNVVLEVNNISYSYGSYQALQDASFTLKQGETFVIVGPNGAGKTTLMLCLSGLLHPASGEVLVDGVDIYHHERAAKRKLAFLPDVPRFYQELTAWEHLLFISLAHGVQEEFEEHAERLLKEFGLSETKDMYPHAFSRGMRLKLGIILCLIRPFHVLLLDEPTSALDPSGKAVLSRMLRDRTSSGAGIVITTHDMAFAREVGSRTVEMHRGRLVFDE